MYSRVDNRSIKIKKLYLDTRKSTEESEDLLTQKVKVIDVANCSLERSKGREEKRTQRGQPLRAEIQILDLCSREEKMLRTEKELSSRRMASATAS